MHARKDLRRDAAIKGQTNHINNVTVAMRLRGGLGSWFVQEEHVATDVRKCCAPPTRPVQQTNSSKLHLKQHIREK